MEKFVHNFSNAKIKHEIEEEFYEKAGKCLGKFSSTTIVTGPDYERHINNVRKYIKPGKIRICEIDLDIFIKIYQDLKKDKLISVVNKSVEHYGSTFIDCDLTCVSDMFAIRNALMKQIDTQSLNPISKVFILSFSLRSSEVSIVTHIKPILGLLGCHINNIRDEISLYANGLHEWKHKVIFGKTNGRVSNLIAYKYNAGGGPMFTCYIEYK